MAPTHVAHDVVNYGLAVGKDALAYSKSKPGVMKWTVEKVEGPVCSVLGSKLGQTAIKVGDRAVTVADGTIDKAMLFEPPFTDQSDQGIMGVFTDDAEVRSIIRILDGINANAEVA